MTKKYLEELVRKMNVLPILLMAVMSVGLASCGDDEKEKDDIVKPDPPHHKCGDHCESYVSDTQSF